MGRHDMVKLVFIATLCEEIPFLANSQMGADNMAYFKFV